MRIYACIRIKSSFFVWQVTTKDRWCHLVRIFYLAAATGRRLGLYIFVHKIFLCRHHKKRCRHKTKKMSTYQFICRDNNAMVALNAVFVITLSSRDVFGCQINHVA